jgi:hypothetical protein
VVLERFCSEMVVDAWVSRSYVGEVGAMAPRCPETN